MRRLALRISTALFSVLAVGILGTSLALAHPVYPNRPHVDAPDLTGTTSPGNTTGGSTDPGTDTSPANTSPGNTSPSTNAGTTGTAGATTGNTSAAADGQAVSGAISGTTNGGRATGGALSGATSGGHQRGGSGAVNYSGSVGRSSTQERTGLGRAASPAVVRTRSGQAVFAGSVGPQAAGSDRARTKGATAWGRSHPDASAALSPSSLRNASPDGTGAGSRLIVGATLFAIGLVTMLGGLLVAEVRRRRAPAGAEGSISR